MTPKAALRYHGAKWMLGAWIIEHLPPHQVYVEPFGGSAAVLLRKPRAYAEVYNDLNDAVVNLFRVLRDPETAAALADMVTMTPFSRVEFSDGMDDDSYSPVERARRLLIRSYMGFGSNSIDVSSGFRSCSNRSGSTPARDWSRWPQRVPFLTDRLQGVIIESRDAETVMNTHDAETTLHYIDPPYVTETRTANGGYKHEFTDQDHVDLARQLHALQGMVVLSGYPSDLYDGLYPDWHQVERPALADGAKARTEVLWLNEAAHRSLEDNKPRLLL